VLPNGHTHSLHRLLLALKSDSVSVQKKNKVTVTDLIISQVNSLSSVGNHRRMRRQNPKPRWRLISNRWQTMAVEIWRPFAFLQEIRSVARRERSHGASTWSMQCWSLPTSCRHESTRQCDNVQFLRLKYPSAINDFVWPTYRSNDIEISGTCQLDKQRPICTAPIEMKWPGLLGPTKSRGQNGKKRLVPGFCWT
jgi:hypothetical protein